MKRVLGILALIALTGLIVVSSISFAQQPQQSPDVNIVTQTRIFPGPEGPPPPGDTFMFMSSEISFEGKPVKGAPYSAQAVTETIQTLGDGNRIVNKTTSSIYRDTEGRTRREQTLKAIGNLGNGGEPLQTIFINDPVAGISYALDPRTHVAHKSMPFRFERLQMSPGTQIAPPPGADGPKFNIKIESGAAEGGVVMSREAAIAPVGGEQFSLRTGGDGPNFVFMRKDQGASPNVVKESLGKQVIEGVEAEGTRETITIPAGEIGNERPIEIVSERWYSTELGTVVMSRHNDPRGGETTYRLTNISRDEPAKSFFEVPGDYTIKEGPTGPPPPGLGPTRIRRPANPE